MKYMTTLNLCLLILSLFLTGCSNSTSSNDVKNTSWVFVANEGEPCWNEFGDDCSLPGNGSISMIDDNGNTKQINNVGYIVHSLEVYKDKLYVIVNQEHKLLTYIINSNGITLENTIITNNSNPREMTVVDDMIYFTNWDTQDIKIFNTNTNQIEEITIPINGRPEDIIYDGTNIWVSVPEINQYDQNQGTQIAMIDPISNIILEYKEVGRGPVSLELFNNEIYISRTYFDETWSPSYGTSKIGDEIMINPYGSGAACGGAIVSFNNQIYRSYEGGIAPLKPNLDIDSINRLGNFIQDNIYHVEIINDNIWFCITNSTDTHLIKVLNSNGHEIASYNVGSFPGDLASWKLSE